MARQGLALLLVRLCGRVERPDLYDIVATSRNEAAVASGTRSGRAADDTARGCGGCPGDRVDAETVGGEDGVLKGAVLELKDTNVAV